jgi:hypothetical protein
LCSATASSRIFTPVSKASNRSLSLATYISVSLTCSSCCSKTCQKGPIKKAQSILEPGPWNWLPKSITLCMIKSFDNKIKNLLICKERWDGCTCCLPASLSSTTNNSCSRIVMATSWICRHMAFQNLIWYSMLLIIVGWSGVSNLPPIWFWHLTFKFRVKVMPSGI